MENITVMNNKSSALCFRKEDFMTDDFSVDKFVSECRRNASLDTMREELGLFLRVLQSAMVELINKDYADFVNLSTNLVGLDKSIKSLSLPLGQLKEEIMSVKQKLDEDLITAQKLVTEREAVHKKKVQMCHLICILEGIENIQKQKLTSSENRKGVLSGEIMERVAIEFNQVLFYMNKSSDLPTLEEKRAVIRKISDILDRQLETMLIDSVYNSDENNLCKVLRIYSAIDKVSEVENKFQVQIVRPKLRKIITEEFITREGIEDMYSSVLDFISSTCTVLLQVTREPKRESESLKNYDFLVNSVWPEVVICLDYISSIVFAPGNPTLFHKNYCATMSFISKFENLCVVQASVKRLREHLLYKSFMDKWNVVVYFHLRFQEIGGLFETALTSPFSIPDMESPFLLNTTAVLWASLKLCWADTVYLPPLCPNFWKLSLQLLSRYLSWVNSLIEIEHKKINQKDYVGDSSSALCIQNVEINDDSPIIQFVKLIQDVETLESQVIHFFEEGIYTKQEMKNLSKQNAAEALSECIKVLQGIPLKIGQIIICHLTDQCCQHLKLITDIPRLYRKTNRDVPSKPSNYMTLVFNPLAAFLSKTESLLSHEQKASWTRQVIENVISECLNMTFNVITSIKKMEDSLRRLKKVREKSAGQNISGTITDDDKIRRQLAIDVEYLGEQIENLGIIKVSFDNYKKLSALVTSAMKSSNAVNT